MLLLFPLLLSLHCWEALWPGTLSTFILCYTSLSLRDGRSWKFVTKFYPLKSYELLRPHKAFHPANHVGFGEKKVWVPFLVRVWVIPVQMLHSDLMDA